MAKPFRARVIVAQSHRREAQRDEEGELVRDDGGEVVTRGRDTTEVEDLERQLNAWLKKARPAELHLAAVDHADQLTCVLIYRPSAPE